MAEIGLHPEPDRIHYFAYGSNMSSARLLARTPSARSLGRASLQGYDLRFHKQGADGSGKCDAFHSGESAHCLHGVLYHLGLEEKSELDRIEGLGVGYESRTVTVTDSRGRRVEALTYVGILLADDLQPWSWYREHVLVGALEAGLPESYIQRIRSVVCLEDPDRDRDAQQRAVHT